MTTGYKSQISIQEQAYKNHRQESTTTPNKGSSSTVNKTGKLKDKFMQLNRINSSKTVENSESKRDPGATPKFLRRQAMSAQRMKLMKDGEASMSKLSLMKQGNQVAEFDS